jgi:hypothetical protein
MMLAAERAEEATTLLAGGVAQRVVIDLCVDDEDAEPQVQSRRRAAREVALKHNAEKRRRQKSPSNKPLRAIAASGPCSPCGLDAPAAPHVARIRHSRTAARGAAALQAVSARETDARVGTEDVRATGPPEVVVLVRRRRAAGARTPHAPSRTRTHAAHSHAQRAPSCAAAPRFPAHGQC